MRTKQEYLLTIHKRTFSEQISKTALYQQFVVWYNSMEFTMALLLRNLASAASMSIFLFMMFAWMNILA